MKNCNVSHSKGNGLFVCNGGSMTIDGNVLFHLSCLTFNGGGFGTSGFGFGNRQHRR